MYFAGKLRAVRIESQDDAHALSDKGEQQSVSTECAMNLPATGAETLSSHVLGSPRVPCYLKRWTRMGQTRDGILESLLLLVSPRPLRQ
jgi:hypothetical protein